jgi:TAT (twin-arginine translocation) pathway signal sequence
VNRRRFLKWFGIAAAAPALPAIASQFPKGLLTGATTAIGEVDRSITAVSVISPGSGYTSEPLVVLEQSALIDLAERRMREASERFCRILEDDFFSGRRIR